MVGIVKDGPGWQMLMKDDARGGVLGKCLLRAGLKIKTVRSSNSVKSNWVYTSESQEKKFDPKKVDFDEGDCMLKNDRQWDDGTLRSV